jgi:hypothetical protein
LILYHDQHKKKAQEGTSRQAKGARGHKASPSLQKQGLVTKFIMFKRKRESLLHFHKIIHYTIKKAICLLGLWKKSVLSIKCFFPPVTFNVKRLRSDKFSE